MHFWSIPFVAPHNLGPQSTQPDCFGVSVLRYSVERALGGALNTASWKVYGTLKQAPRTEQTAQTELLPKGGVRLCTTPEGRAPLLG